tara:strand:- start:1041 stop:1826 length:786 start_codon:yes stop_codon:yes gene_type:complete
MIKPLEKNDGGYFGETIEINDILHRALTAAKQHGWITDTFSGSSEIQLFGFRRIAQNERLSAYISSGIHGDEPGGPLALIEMIESDIWPNDVSLFICPCLNPTGFQKNTRENSIGIDLNRDYRHFSSFEAKAHRGWIDSLPSFDISICVHEDWEATGFYLYELNPDEMYSASQSILNAVSTICPIDQSELIDGRPAKSGLLKPLASPDARPLWPEAFYIVQNNKTRLSYTLEAPSDFPLYFRAITLRRAIETILNTHLSKS